jgi:hypothetical protein
VAIAPSAASCPAAVAEASAVSGAVIQVAQHLRLALQNALQRRPVSDAVRLGQQTDVLLQLLQLQPNSLRKGEDELAQRLVVAAAALVEESKTRVEIGCVRRFVALRLAPIAMKAPGMRLAQRQVCLVWSKTESAEAF